MSLQESSEFSQEEFLDCPEMIVAFFEVSAAKDGLSEEPEIKTQRQRLYDICELACRFFEKQLQASNVGKEATQYLLSRGIKEPSIKEWRLGYSPDAWQGLSDFLVSKGYTRE